MKNKLAKTLMNFGKALLLVIACLSVVTTTVNADSAPKTLTIKGYDKKSTPVKWPRTFHVKKASNGKYVYCVYYSKDVPKSNIKFTKSTLIKDNGMNYILNEAMSAKNDNNFFIYQTALWVYMVDKNIMPGTHNDITKFKKTLKSSNSDAAKKIKELVANAKKAGKNDTTAPTISVSTNNVSFTQKDNYYVSNNIVVTSSTGKYDVTLTTKPDGTTYEKNGNNLVIKVPTSKVTTTSDVVVNFKVSNSKDIYTSYNYKTSNSKYQVMSATYKDTLKKEAAATVKIDKKKVSIPVLKVDSSTGKAISGAGLQVLDSNGKVIDSWSSTTSAHKVNNLAAGTYTLKELSAPKGYKLSNVQVKFTVNADGTVTNSNGTKITEIRYSNEITAVTISKQDITSKAEVPGAKLVIRDSNNNKIAEWTSSDKKYVIKGLAAGTYKLTETLAPAGYALSSETITFKIDKYGKLYNGNGEAKDYIVMYNEKKNVTKDVHISKRDITTSEEVPGAQLKVTNASNGSVVDSWTSTKEEHIIKNLAAGTYKLTETIAPTGYKLSSTTITFSINSEGVLSDANGNAISKIIMYNEKKPTTGSASISKQDATNSKELPGASLVVKDSEGKVIDKWISTNEPHLIENLKPGMYTLTETIAPSGYILSSETVTFTIKEDGSVTPVVMKNAPDSKDVPTPDTPEKPATPETPTAPTPTEPAKQVPVESTGSFATITTSLIGTIIMLVGSLFIAKSSKKNVA